jgi:hypothetical protein
MKHLILFIIGALLVIQACSPKPVYRLKAEADKDQTSYYQGVEYIHMQKDSVQLTVSYYEHTSTLFALEVEVINNSDRIIQVTPDSFKYESYARERPENPGKLLTINTAKDPEQKILDIDMELSRQKARQRSDEIFYYTLQGLTLASTVTADTKEKQEKTEEDLVDNALQQEMDRNRHRYNRSSLRQNREFWEAEVLRITDLWPNESIRGLVYFKTDAEARLYNIMMNIEDLHFNTWFLQQKYDPQHSIDKD